MLTKAAAIVKLCEAIIAGADPDLVWDELELDKLDFAPGELNEAIWLYIWRCPACHSFVSKALDCKCGEQFSEVNEQDRLPLRQLKIQD